MLVEMKCPRCGFVVNLGEEHKWMAGGCICGDLIREVGPSRVGVAGIIRPDSDIYRRALREPLPAVTWHSTANGSNTPRVSGWRLAAKVVAVPAAILIGVYGAYIGVYRKSISDLVLSVVLLSLCWYVLHSAHSFLEARKGLIVKVVAAGVGVAVYLAQETVLNFIEALFG